MYGDLFSRILALIGVLLQNMKNSSIFLQRNLNICVFGSDDLVMKLKISRHIVLLALVVLSLTSCDDGFVNPALGETVECLVPVYAPYDENFEEIFRTDAREFENLGNIVLYKEYIFLIERLQGIHVLDNSDPAMPVNLHFLNIPGVSELTIDEDILFVNYGVNLILIDISDLSSITVVDAIEDFYPIEELQLTPPDYFGSFECVDTDKGIVVDWITDTRYNPNCWTW